MAHRLPASEAPAANLDTDETSLMQRWGILVIATSITAVGVLIGLWSAPSVGQTPARGRPPTRFRASGSRSPVPES